MTPPPFVLPSPEHLLARTRTLPLATTLMSPEIYLDHAATTPLAPLVLRELTPYLHLHHGNPSSRHRLGVHAAEAVDLARRRVARALGSGPHSVVFTAGGTEANNLAVLGLARARGRALLARQATPHVLVGPTEHPSVQAPAAHLATEGFDVTTLRLDAAGELDLDHLAAELRATTVLVAQMLVNNEFGTIYPVERVARIVRANAPLAAVHTDAVQGLGKLEVSLGELGAHSLSISAHKIHGPKGAGALVLADGVRPEPLVHGGGQEGGLRSGTENVAGIVGLGKAAELAAEETERTAAALGELRELLRSELTALRGARLLDPGARRSPAICAILLPGAPAEVWMHHLEERGISTSVGSACQARKREIPAALAALGLDEAEAKRVLRISFSRLSTADEVRRAVGALRDVEAGLGTAR